ncbi:MAG: hypothetical protein IKR68_03155, partial [Lachnospiraceae bacterium]|nr:hypothetical protein [Lachnospiraceae bacterium]
RKLFRHAKTNKVVAAILSAAMVLTSMSSPVLAASEELFEEAAANEAVVEESSEISEETVLSAEGGETSVDAEFAAAFTALEEQINSVSDNGVSGNGMSGNGVSDGGTGDSGNGNGSGDEGTTSGNSTPSSNGVDEKKPEMSKVSDDDKATFVYDGVKAEFDTSYKTFSAEYSLGNIKLTYKIPGAKTYAIAKILFLENGSDVTVIKSKEDGFKGKSYVDKDVTNGWGGGAYVIEAFGDGGSLLGKYITIPRTFIVDASAVAGGYVDVTFAAVGFGATYTIERSDNKKFNGSTSWTFTEDELKYCTVANRDCFIFRDTPDKSLTGFGNMKHKYFYRVTASARTKVGADTYDLVSKTSASKGVSARDLRLP